MTEPAPYVRSEVAGGVATLTLDSPHNRNALSVRLMGQLLHGLNGAIADDAVRVIVLTHDGPVFCSGADLKAAAGAHDAGGLPLAGAPDIFQAIWESPKPVVARIAGPARAGGLGLIAAADVAVTTTEATFAFTEVRLGVIPALISGVVLPRLAPRAAAELFLTGATFDGRRAADIGLVTAAVPAGQLDETVASYVTALIRGAPNALAATKQLLRQAAADPIGPRLAALAELSSTHFLSDEGREGMAAFAAKRDAGWIPQ